MADSDPPDNAPSGNLDFPSQPTVWPPPPTNAPAPTAFTSNTSGLNLGVPPQIAALKWNWGAFTLGMFWSGNHNMLPVAIALLVLNLSGLVPCIGPYLMILAAPCILGLSIYLGVNGNRLGWQKRHFPGGVEQFIDVQKRWMWWGIGLTAATILFFVLNIGLWMSYSTMRGKYLPELD